MKLVDACAPPEATEMVMIALPRTVRLGAYTVTVLFRVVAEKVIRPSATTF
jgi:hypothetical protein